MSRQIENIATEEVVVYLKLLYQHSRAGSVETHRNLSHNFHCPRRGPSERKSDAFYLEITSFFELRPRMCFILCRIVLVQCSCGHYIEICSKLSGGSGWRYISTEHAKVCAKWEAE
jgi:hypothetical protein